MNIFGAESGMAMAEALGRSKGFPRVSLTPRAPRNDLGGAGWPALVESVSRLQNLLASTNPPIELVGLLTGELDALSDQLELHPADEAERPAGQRSDSLRRGHPLLPSTMVDEKGENHLAGRVVFEQFYLGNAGAAHGGAVSLFFDEIVGLLVATAYAKRVRTAYLHVDYRSITPIDTELYFHVRIDRREGRKIFVKGILRDNETVCAESEILMVELLPHHH